MTFVDLRPHITPIVAQIVTKLPNGDWKRFDNRKFKTVPNNGHLLEIKTHENEDPIIYEVLEVLHLATSTEGVDSTEVDVKIYVKPKELISEVSELQNI